MSIRSSHITLLMIMTVVVVVTCHGQLRSLNGTINGEFEQNELLVKGYRDILSRYRQLITLELMGNAYNHNLADFSLRTSIMNTNSSSRNGGLNRRSNSLHFNYYDLSVLLLKRTRLPITFYLRRDVQWHEIVGYESRNILKTGGGVNLSYSFNNGSLPKISFGYERFNSESLIPDNLYAQENTRYHAGLSQSLRRTTFSVNYSLSERDEKGLYAGRNTYHHTRFQQHTDLGRMGQLSTNSRWNRYGKYDNIRWSTIWNYQISAKIRNHASLDYAYIRTGSYLNYDIGLREAVDVSFSRQWRSSLNISHSMGKARAVGGQKPSGSTSAAGSVTYQMDTEKIQPTITTKVDYRERDGDFRYQQYGGAVTVGLASKRWSNLQVTVTDGLSIRRYINGTSYSIVGNDLSWIVQTTLIPRVRLGVSGSAFSSREMGRPIRGNRLELRNSVNGSYQWLKWVRMFLSGNFSYYSTKTDYVTRNMYQYSFEIIIPDVFYNLMMSLKGSKSRDMLRGTFNSNLTVSMTYRYRSILFSGRWIRNAYGSYSRDNYLLTVARPFNISL